MRRLYYFKNMDQIVDKFCKQCKICIKNKSRTRRPIEFMSKPGPAKKPFEIMSFDTVGGYSNNISSKKFMHILMDHFSRTVFMSTSKTQRSDDITKLIDSTGETDRSLGRGKSTLDFQVDKALIFIIIYCCLPRILFKYYYNKLDFQI